MIQIIGFYVLRRDNLEKILTLLLFKNVSFWSLLAKESLRITERSQ